MYYQKDYDSEPEYFPDPPHEDEDERRHRLQEDEWWKQYEALQALPNLLNQPDLPF